MLHIQVPLLQDALSEFAKFQAELKVKSAHLSNLRVDISNPTASLSMLKGKSLYSLLHTFTPPLHRTQISQLVGVCLSSLRRRHRNCRTIASV